MVGPEGKIFRIEGLERLENACSELLNISSLRPHVSIIARVILRHLKKRASYDGIQGKGFERNLGSLS